MAKAKASTKAKAIVDVSSRMTDSEILAAEERDVKMRFDPEDWRELPEKVIGKLSHENQRDYFITKGAVDAMAKNSRRAAAGFGGIEIVDPLKAKPRAKLDTFDIPPGMHACWKRPDEVEEMKGLGYTIADQKVRAPGASKTSTSHIITDTQGKDDLVLMLIPEKVFQQHLEANALLSRKRAGATMREITGMVKKANQHLEDVELPNLVETTSVDEVPIRVDRGA